VTLLVDPLGAEAVALGQAQGKIHLVLRNPVDQELVEVKPTDTRTILGIQPTKPPAPAPAPRRERRAAPTPSKPEPVVVAPAPPPPPAPKPEPPTFTVIRDGNISKQNSATEAKPNP
jgi:hypothetical protein